MICGAQAAGFENDPGAFTDAFADAAGVIHDLGNLIQIAASALNIVGRSPRAEQDAYLEPVLQRARAALDRAGDLLDQSRARSLGPTVVVARSQDLQDIPACLDEIQPLISWVCAPDIVLSIEAATDLPQVRCNRIELQSAVLNLVTNARDALPEGGSIRIIARPVREGFFAGTVELSVMDDGTGMSRETLNRVFTPYFTTKACGRGTGLGLALVQRFAQETGGRVGIVSALGAGTAVILRLPANGADQRRTA